MTPEIFFENFGHLAEAPGGVGKLRDLVFQLAVRGRLVPQRPGDEPADIPGIRGLRLKNESLWNASHLGIAPLAGWVRTPLAALGSWGSGGTPRRSQPEYYGGTIPWLKIADLNGGVIEKATTGITALGLEKSSAKMIPVGAVLIAMYGSIGKAAVTGIECSSNQAIAHCVPRPGAVTTWFLFLLVKALTGDLVFQGKGGAQQNISQTVLKHLVVDIPPLAEQRRIVAKVDQLMILCDELEARQQTRNETRIALNNASLDRLLMAPDDKTSAQHWHGVRDNFEILYEAPDAVRGLRQAILDLAIAGRLTCRDPTANAADLLTEVRSKADGKKLKRFKPVTDEEAPAAIPREWEWARLGELGETQTGTTPPKKDPSNFGDFIPFIKPGHLDGMGVTYGGEGLSEKGLNRGRLLPNGSVLMVCIGGSIGKTALVEQDVSCNQQINGISPFPPITGRLLVIALRSSYFQREVWRRAGHGTLPILSKGKWQEIPVPIPGAAEQERIIDRVEYLLTLCDELEAKLQQSQDGAAELLDSVVHHLLAA